MHEVDVKLSTMHLGGRKRVPYLAIFEVSCVRAFLYHLWRNVRHS